MIGIFPSTQTDIVVLMYANVFNAFARHSHLHHEDESIVCNFWALPCLFIFFTMT